MIRITELKLSLDQAITKESERRNLKKQLLKKLSLSENMLLSFSLYKKAIDARKRDQVHFVYTVDVSIKNEDATLSKPIPHVKKVEDEGYREVTQGNTPLNHRPVIIGFGPSGMFAALLLARRGYRPVVLERGPNALERSEKIEQFFRTGILDQDGTILFGEGGAGTFSDGKLTTQITDTRCRYISEALVKHGADEEILYINRPHVGTDVLRHVVVSLRKEIEALGGEVRFHAHVSDLVLKNNQIEGVVVNGKETIPCEVCLLGIGHSARDTYPMLQEKGISLSQKPFSIGVRIEHPQKLIDQSQYGKQAGHPALGSADYKLSYHAKNGRTAYTFCMCPGGFVVNSSSEEGMLCTNGMSEQARDQVNANSAFLVSVTPEDYPSKDPLAGVEYQRQFERKAFAFGGKNFHAPIQLVGDFLNRQKSAKLGEVTPSIRPGYVFSSMDEILPDYITDCMREALPFFDQKIKGFAMKDAILTGVEARSSSPVRINRNEDFQSNISGLIPMGEGAGYSGGIMSSAVDGMKCAEQVILKFKPKKP
ncbi:MAG: hypothetical protein PHP32_00910 [Candidatus Izemoplasmatales bacterium]|nr:hypothetical protein [Candidatus Izemoplasmatales bacterium]